MLKQTKIELKHINTLFVLFVHSFTLFIHSSSIHLYVFNFIYFLYLRLSMATLSFICGNDWKLQELCMGASQSCCGDANTCN